MKVRVSAHSFRSFRRKSGLPLISICASIACLVYVYANHLATTSLESWTTQLTLNNTYCGWNESIYASPDGRYQLHLCYASASDNTYLLDTGFTIEESKIRINGSSRRLRFEDLASIPDAEWLPNFDASVYQLYPQSIAMRTTLQSLINGRPISQPPIFNPWIRFLQVPSTVCSPLFPQQAANGLSGGLSRHDVVIVYKSGVYNFEERSRLRNLYHLYHPDVSIHLIFSIGLPRTSLDNVFQRDGFNVTLTNRAGMKLKEHSRNPLRTTELLAKEMHEYDDLLVGDYEDSYYNLTLKMFHTFQWAARFCRLHRPIFVFLDDDYAVNTNKLVTFVRGLTAELRENLNYGCEVIANPVFRHTDPYPQWAFSKRDVPWPFHMPQYLGIYSMWSYRHVHDLALAMHFTKPMVIDDTWMGMVQYKLNLTPKSLEGMFRESWPMPRHVNCSDIFFAHLREFEQRKCAL